MEQQQRFVENLDVTWTLEANNTWSTLRFKRLVGKSFFDAMEIPKGGLNFVQKQL